MRAFVVPLMVVLSSVSVMAEEIVPGFWNDDFIGSRAYAEQTGKPFFAYLSCETCTYCEAYEAAVNQQDFLAWAKQNDVILCHKHAMRSDFISSQHLGDWTHLKTTVSDDLKAAVLFCYEDWQGAPYIGGAKPQAAFYQKGIGKVNFCGRMGSYSIRVPSDDPFNPETINQLYMLIDSGDSLSQRTIDSGNYFFGFGDTIGTISVGEVEGNRLEAERKTAWVPVPAIRSQTMSTVSAQLDLRAESEDGSVSVTCKMAWERGEIKGLAWVPMQPFAKVFKPGEKIRLSLADRKGAVISTNSITLVEDVPVSATNPHWLGEDFTFGEWTMDLDAALKKTAEVDGEAYTIVYFTGALWCPHCQGLDEGVLSHQAFADWAKSNRISLVELDNPRRSPKDDLTHGIVDTEPKGQPPTLLRYAAGTNTFVRAEVRSPSGAGYLSRKSISNEVAEAVLQRNHTLGYSGGRYCAPNALRTGYPTVILLNKAGAIVGRLKISEGAGNVCETEENMWRLGELLKLAERADESGDFAETTRDELALGGSVQVGLQVNSPVRHFRLRELGYGQVTISSQAAHDVFLEYLRDGEIVVSGTNTLTFASGLVDVRAKDALLKVSSLAVREAFSATVSASIVKVPGTIRFAERSLRVSEADGSVDIVLLRDGGDKGTSAVKVRMAGDDPRFDLSDAPCIWGDGVSGEQRIRLSVRNNDEKDGDAVAVLWLEPVAGTETVVAGTRLEVLVVDDDVFNSPGALVLSDAGNGFSGRRSVIAQSGSLSVRLAREGGWLGSPTAYVVLMMGGVEVARSSVATWQDRSPDNLKTVSVEIPALDLPGLATLVLKSETADDLIDPARDRARVQIVGRSVPTFERPAVEACVQVGFVASISVGLTPVRGGRCAVVPMDGSLPSGLTAAVDDGALVVSGVPTAAGVYTAAFRAKEILASGEIIYGTTVLVTIDVPEPMPRQASAETGTQQVSVSPYVGRAFTCKGLPLIANGRLQGLVSFSASSVGKLSAKCRTTDGSASYATSGWKNPDSADKAMQARLLRVSAASSSPEYLDVYLTTSGMLHVDWGMSSGEMAIDGWADNQRALAWAGNYTVQMPQVDEIYAGTTNLTGVATMSLRMSRSCARSGVMLYAGTLPNGATISGTSLLLPQEGKSLWMPFLNVGEDAFSRATVSGVLAISPQRKVSSPLSVSTYWENSAGTSAAKASRLEIYGDFYDKDSVLNKFKSDYEIDSYRVFFVVDPLLRLPGNAFPAVQIAVSDANRPFIVGDNEIGLKFSFKASTGVMTGSFRADSRLYHFSGIVLPGWGECDQCSADAIERPFMSGCCWFNDSDAQGLTFRNGCSVVIHRLGARIE